MHHQQKKNMATVFWDDRGVTRVDIMPRVTDIAPWLWQWDAKRSNAFLFLHTRNVSHVLLLHANARLHTHAHTCMHC